MRSDEECVQASRERRQARQGLLDFTTYTFPGYRPERAHRLIAAALDQVLAGSITRLMIFAPPQHGKSELASVRLPALWLGRRPDDPIIVTSYAASLALAKSRAARTIVESPPYALLFPQVRTRADSRAVDHWELASPHRGGLLAAGVGGPVTGHGARLAIIDDPVENWQAAQSPAIRQTCWDWYRTTLRTRLWDGGAIILIMTRWHQDDLAGRLLASSEPWITLRLPALAETPEERATNSARLSFDPPEEADPLGRVPGEPLAPQRFPLEALQAIRQDVGAVAWAGQYQGVPIPAEGGAFKRAWFAIVEGSPVGRGHARPVRRARYWDKAGTAGGGAYTAGVLMAQAGGIYYVEDVVRGQWGPGERERWILDTARRDARLSPPPQVYVEQEPADAGRESAQATIRNLAGFPVRADPATGSKDVRLQPFAAQAEAGNVRLKRGPWNDDYLDELCALPNGRYRDQADATAGAFNKLARSGGESALAGAY